MPADPSPLHPAAVALGGNLGDRRDVMRRAKDRLEQELPLMGATRLRFSRLYDTEPMGPPQARYLNAALAFDVPLGLSPFALLERLRAIETGLGRIRRERWGPRTLDLDIVVFGATVISTPLLTLPHAHAHERPFVLWPLLDVWPDAVLPGHGPVRPIAAKLGRAGLVAVTEDGRW